MPEQYSDVPRYLDPPPDDDELCCAICLLPERGTRVVAECDLCGELACEECSESDGERVICHDCEFPPL